MSIKSWLHDVGDSKPFQYATGIFEPSTMKKIAPYAAAAGAAYLTMGGSLPASMAALGSSGMGSTLGAGAAGLGSIISKGAPLISGYLNYKGQQDTNAANAQQAQKQMDYQTQMSNTSYQRGMADMEAAGLNPMLAYSQGGASVPGGSQATMGNSLGAGANSAMSTAATLQAMEQQAAQTQNIGAQTAYTNQQTQESAARTANELLKPEGITGSNTKVQREAEGMLPKNEVSYLEAQILRNTRQAQEDQLISNAKRASAEAKKADYGLAKERVYNKYYNDPSKLTGGGYEPWRTAVQENVNSAAGAVSKFIPKLPW
ncbi:MAG: DNA pilot protein [Microviridae sp.]|nr:MAG: DNA pilot protein [Microviridae sp.]